MVQPAGAAPGAEPSVHPLPRRRLLVVMGGVLVVMFLSALDQTVVSTALPRIVGELGGVEQLSWVVTAYLLASTVTIPLYGKLSDLHGRRAMFVLAIAIFLVGSALAGTSRGMTELIVYRGVQGIGAGGIWPLSMALVGDVIAPRDRGRWQGVMSAVFALSSVLGPAIGGTLTDHASWRWIFFLNVPLAGGAIVVVLRALDIPFERRQHRIDFWGAALLAGGTSALLLVFVWGGTTHPWGSAVVLGMLTGAAVLLSWFFARERRAPEPILPLSLFRNHTVSITSAVSFLIGAGLFGTALFMPLFVQGVIGASATRSGAIITPFMLGVIVTNAGGGWLISRTGRYKALPVAGAGLLIVGFWLLTTMGRGTTDAEAVRNMVVLGLGMGLILPVMVIAAQNAVPRSELGVATGMINFARSIGATIGVAGLGAIFTHRLHGLLAAAGGPALLREPRALVEPSALAALPPEAVEHLRGAMATALHGVFLVGIPVGVAILAATLLLRERPLRTTPHVGVAEELAPGASAAAG